MENKDAIYFLEALERILWQARNSPTDGKRKDNIAAAYTMVEAELAFYKKQNVRGE